MTVWVISALYGNVMSDLGVQESRGRAGPGYRARRDSVSVRPRPLQQHQQHSTAIIDTTAVEMEKVCVFYYKVISVNFE